MKAAYMRIKAQNLDDRKLCGDCDANANCDEAYLEDSVGDNANARENACSACKIQYSLESYPDHAPVFVPRCLHVICSKCCKSKAVPNRKCPVDGCGVDCASDVNAFPMHVGIVKRLRDLYTKRTSPSSTETYDEVTTKCAAQLCNSNRDMTQQQQGAALCKEGKASGPIKHEAKWYCSNCDESFCDDYYQNMHQQFKLTKDHPVVALKNIDPVKRHEASLTKCSNPRHLGADVSVYDVSTRTFHCRLCAVSPQTESAAETMQKDYAAITDMLQSSEGIYAKCAELKRNIAARIVYESNVLKDECDRVNAWYSVSIARLSKMRDGRIAKLHSVSKQTQTRLKAELAKLTPLVQSVEAAAVDIGVRPHRHTGEVLHQRTNQSDAPVVRKAKMLLDTLSNLLTELRSPAQDCYTSACATGPDTRNTIGNVVAADVSAPVSKESSHYPSSLNTAVYVALNIAKLSSSPPTPSSPSLVMSPATAFHHTHRTAKDVTVDSPSAVDNAPVSSSDKKDADNSDINPMRSLGACSEHRKGLAKTTTTSTAFELYQKAADRGHVPAMFNLGVCYANGTGVAMDKSKAVEWYQKAADGGNFAAMTNLGSCYEKGTGLARNISKAVKWYKKAADGGNIDAMVNFGLCFEYATGVAKDVSKAIGLYKKAADGGNLAALNSLGLCYEYGKGVDKDESKAVELYQKAADGGNFAAMNSLGLCYEYGKGVDKDESKAVELYKKAADGGNFAALNSLGLCYEYGKGVDKDESKAVELYQKAADGGNVDAIAKLAVCFEYAKGVAKDKSKAVELYQKAADGGNSEAMRNLGLCYQRGTGGALNESKAVEWYQKAADSSNLAAMNNLGLCYRRGIGVAKDESKAFGWYKKAVDGGNADAMVNLGLCFEHGTCVAKDESKAVVLYKKAADGGNFAAMNHLGFCYQYGKGVAKDESKAVELYQKAADGGSIRAMRNLGVCYQRGTGVAKDESKAVELYQKAADGGNSEAMRNLGLCYQRGTGVAKDESKAVEWCKKAEGRNRR